MTLRADHVALGAGVKTLTGVDALAPLSLDALDPPPEEDEPPLEQAATSSVSATAAEAFKHRKFGKVKEAHNLWFGETHRRADSK